MFPIEAEFLMIAHIDHLVGGEEKVGGVRERWGGI